MSMFAAFTCMLEDYVTLNQLVRQCLIRNLCLHYI